jgi:hypothetical protein
MTTSPSSSLDANHAIGGVVLENAFSSRQYALPEFDRSPLNLLSSMRSCGKTRAAPAVPIGKIDPQSRDRLRCSVCEETQMIGDAAASSGHVNPPDVITEAFVMARAHRPA